VIARRPMAGAVPRRRGDSGVWLLVLGALLLASHLGPATAPAKPEATATQATRSAAASSSMAARAVAYARGQLGKPYQWGADGPAAFDCSGLAGAAWRAAGLDWPDLTAAGQWHWLHQRGRDVPHHALKPGDLVFYAHHPGDWRSIHHVAIYLGHARMIEAPYPGALIRQVPLRTRGWFAAARPEGGGP
jgi:peptidoglycan DL-endopeptidase CwlO